MSKSGFIPSSGKQFIRMQNFCTDGLIVIGIAFSFQVSKAQKPWKDLNPSRTKDAKGMFSPFHYIMLLPFFPCYF
jgi:hypothetical protein